VNPWLHAIVVAVEIGLAAVAAEYARRGMVHAIDARYEAEYANRCARGARAAARYVNQAVQHLEAHAGVPVPAALRAAWDAVGIGHVRYRAEADAPTEDGPKTPA